VPRCLATQSVGVNNHTAPKYNGKHLDNIKFKRGLFKLLFK